MAASFPWIGGGNQSAGAYFHLQPGNVYLGGGVWHPDSGWVSRWRAFVDERGDELHEALEAPAFSRRFGDLEGDSLRRVPSGFPADHPDAALLKLTDVTFGARIDDADALSPDLPERVATMLADAVGVMRILASVGA